MNEDFNKWLIKRLNLPKQFGPTLMPEEWLDELRREYQTEINEKEKENE
jgi:hypothetical protein